MEQLLAARHHHYQAVDLEEAISVTETVCFQFDTWGAYRREEQLCRETSVFLEVQLLHEIDVVAEELQISRSRLLAEAAREFLRRHENAALLGALNEFHAEGPSEDDMERLRFWKQQYRRRIEGLRWPTP